MKHSSLLMLILQSLIYLSSPLIASAQLIQTDIEVKDSTEALPALPFTTAPSPKISPQPNAHTFAPSSLGTSLDIPFLSFGFLVPGDPITRSHTLVITNTNTSYSVYVGQNRSLSAEDGTAIPDTTCDDGGCTTAVASTWESPLTYGFGFRCENAPACASDFVDERTYRPLTDREKSLTPVLSTSASKTHAMITYKVNISAAQLPVPYSNTITYTLIPHL